MSIKGLLSEYGRRVSKEARIKAVVWGAVIAFAANVAAALLTWCLGVKNFGLFWSLHWEFSP